MSTSERPHLWLRVEEVDKTEKRAPLAPKDAGFLVSHGIQVTVEKSPQRIYADDEYAKEGCALVEPNTWATAPSNAVILGLQSLSTAHSSYLTHRHIFFSYSFRGQSGSEALLYRFLKGQGTLYDLEYLTDVRGRRVTYFGPFAGAVGMASALMVWCYQRQGVKEDHPQADSAAPEKSANSPQVTTRGSARVTRTDQQKFMRLSENRIQAQNLMTLLTNISQLLESVSSFYKRVPKIAILGAGRVGTGASEFADALGLEYDVWLREDLEAHRTKDGIPALLDYDVVINAIKLPVATGKDRELQPFLTKKLLFSSNRKLSVVMDISCDVYNPSNPLPIYAETTTFTHPTHRVIDNAENPLDVIAIENLCALHPRESSFQFSSDLLPILFEFLKGGDHFRSNAFRGSSAISPFTRARQSFEKQMEILRRKYAAPPAPYLKFPSDHPVDWKLPHYTEVTCNMSPDLVEKINGVFDQLEKLENAPSVSAGQRVSVFFAALLMTLVSRLCGEDEIQIGHLEFAQEMQTIEFLKPLRLFLGDGTFSKLVQDLASQFYTPDKQKDLLTQMPFHSIADAVKKTALDFQLFLVTDRDAPEIVHHFVPDLFELNKELLIVHVSNPPTSPPTGTNIDNNADNDVAARPSSAVSAPSKPGLQVTISFNESIYLRDRISHLASQLMHLATLATAAPNSQSAAFSLVTERGISVLPQVNSAPDLEWDSGTSIHCALHAAALRTPTAPAIVDVDGTITSYAALDSVTSQIGNFLRTDTKVGCGQTVTIFGHRSARMVEAVMGILKSGAAMNVIDPGYPPERIVTCLNVAGPSAVIQVVGDSNTVPLPESVTSYLAERSIPILVLARNRKGDFGYEQCSTDMPEVQVGADDVAVVTFTSGSTGIPKGVLGRHSSLTHFYRWMSTEFGLGAHDQFSMCSGIAHDPLQRDIFTPLFFGATIRIPTQETVATPGHLARWMQTYSITVTCLTPAAGQLLSEIDAEADFAIRTLRVALFVGDKLTKRDVLRLRRIAPQVAAVNMYGSTETQRAVTYYVVPPTPVMEGMKEILPVGKGMKSVQLLVLNAHSQLCGVGELGELYTRSAHISRGYKDLPEVTAAKFVANPLANPRNPRDLCYRTGDLGRYNTNGDVECAGRVDDQVKIRGFRIELGEINSALAQHAAVRENVVVVKEDSVSKYIVAYIVPQKGQLTPAGHILRKFLAAKLPAYMIPSCFVIIDQIPLTPNAKINYAALPTPQRVEEDRLDKVAHSSIPSRIRLKEYQYWEEMFPIIKELHDQETSIDQIVTKLWCSVLSVALSDRLDQDDTSNNFFALGGHSLLATKFISQLRTIFRKDFTISILWKNPTLGALIDAVKNLVNEDTAVPRDEEQINFDADLSLPSEITASSVPTCDPSTPASTLFFTGATGFLGTFILSNLVAREGVRKVYCLCRSAKAQNRLWQNLKLISGWKDEYEAKIVLVEGDLAELKLGIKEELYAEIANTAQAIIHNGAIVHWVFGYKELYNANVRGTAEVLRLATTSQLKRVVYVSTTSVFDSNTYQQHIDQNVLEEPVRSDYTGLAGGYPQTKYAAERLLEIAKSRNVPIDIVRPGYISGSSLQGMWTTDDFLCRLIKGSIQLGVYPDFKEARIDVVPVDCVARDVVQVVLGPYDKELNIFHAIPAQRFLLTSFFTAAKEMGFAMQSKEYRQWRQQLLAEMSEENALFPISPLFTDNYVEQLPNPPYSTANSKKKGLLSVDSDIEKHLPLYFAYFVNCGFLPENATTKATTTNVATFTRSK